MNEQERQGFVEAMAKAMELMREAHGALQAAQLRCHGSLYDHVAPMAKRIYESRITAEWLQQVALGRLTLESQGAPHPRQTPDRRQALDRRIAGIRKDLISLDTPPGSPDLAAERPVEGAPGRIFTPARAGRDFFCRSLRS